MTMGNKTTIKISKEIRDKLKQNIPKSQTFEDSLKEWVGIIERRNKNGK